MPEWPHFAGQPQPGHESHGGRGHKDHQRRHHPPRQRVVEHQPVHHQRQQHDPEDHAAGKEQPADLDMPKRHARDGHDHVAHRRDEPGRCHLPRLERAMPDPRPDHRQRQHALQRGPDDPDDPRRLRPDRKQRHRDQQKRNRHGREKGDTHGVVPFLGDGGGVQQRLQPIAKRHRPQHQQRQRKGGMRQRRVAAPGQFGGMQRQRQARHAHADGKEGDGVMLQPVGRNGRGEGVVRHHGNS
jgi:hypothetical protein